MAFLQDCIRVWALILGLNRCECAVDTKVSGALCTFTGLSSVLSVSASGYSVIVSLAGLGGGWFISPTVA